MSPLIAQIFTNDYKTTLLYLRDSSPKFTINPNLHLDTAK